jgi:hypothetical protein
MSIEGRIIVDALFHDRSTNNLSSEVRVAAATYSLPLADGTGANQAQVAWTSSATVTGSGADELVVQALTDDRGTVSLSAVKAIYIRNKSSLYALAVTVDNWTALDPTLYPFNAVIQPGGVIALTNPTATGWTTGASSAILLIAQGEEQTVDYDILLVGEGTAS